MKTLQWTGPLVALALFGCGNAETALRIQRVATPSSSGSSGGCAFSAGDDEGQLSLQFDTKGPHLFTIPLIVQNNLIAGEIDLGTKTEETFSYPNDVTPLYFDLRWECDANGFGDDLGALYLPQFSVDLPFCLDRRENTDGKFRGFDVVPAAGGAIEAGGGKGIVDIRPITPQLAASLDDFFTLAVQAESCCRQVGGCQAVTEQLPESFPAGTACANLVQSFEAVAPGKLSTTRLSDIQKFRPFAIYDGDFFTTYISSTPGAVGRTPGYAMRMRGVLQGVTGDGSSVTSGEFSEIITVCRDCGGSTTCTDR